MAKAALIAEQLGKGNATDFLAISFSSPDYIGHAFGPNSWEMVDDYVKLDEELGKLFDLLDKQLSTHLRKLALKRMTKHGKPISE